MTPVVKARLDRILKYPFFSAVGQPLLPNVSRVDTWPRAAKTCGLVKWSNSQLQAGNALQDGITDQFPKPGMWERMQEWNPLCRELKRIICPFVEGLVSKLPLNDRDRKNVRDAVNWDLLSVCLEANYQDIVKPPFYIPYMDPWYAAGHFPCGWDGDEFSGKWDGVLSGQLIVF